MSQPQIGLDIDGYHKTALPESLYKKYKKLMTYRTREDLAEKVKKSRYLKETFLDLEGNEVPLRLRYYQVQGLLHLASMPRFLLGDDTGLGKCAVPDTLLRTRRGLVRIGDLQAGAQDPDTFGPVIEDCPEVWTGSRWSPVKTFFDSGVKPSISVWTDSGFEVEGSLHHPIWVRRASGEQFCRLDELDVGDYVAIERRKAEFPAEEYTVPAVSGGATNAKAYDLPDTVGPELARFMGYYVAEGHSPCRGRVTLTQHDPEAHADIRQLAESCFGWSGNENNQNADISIQITSTHIHDFLSACGLGWGLSGEKEIPCSVLQGTEEVARQFLRGLFEGDGGPIDRGIEYTTKSRTLSAQVQALLLSFGIVSVRKRRSTGHYRLTIFSEDAKIFAEEIGFVTSRKRERLEREIAKTFNPNLDIVPHCRELVESLRGKIYGACGLHGYKGEGFSTRWGSAFYNTFGHLRAGRRNPTYAWLRRVREVMQELEIWDLSDPSCVELQQILTEHRYWTPVQYLNEGETRLVDIEVEAEEHAFVGNGFINHNTIQAIAALCFLWDKKPNNKVMVVTTKSAAGQWVDEFDKFTAGVQTFLCKGTPKKREKIYQEWLDYEGGPCVIVMGYATVRQDITRISQNAPEGLWLITDEATAYKTPSTRIYQCIKYLSQLSDRHWALTATLIENHLLEGWAIYSALIPKYLAGKTWFTNTFCIVQPTRVGRKWIDKIVGYRPGAPEDFKRLIEPFFLGRPKMMVAKELPPLTRKRFYVDLSRDQQEKYDEASEGLLGIKDEEGTEHEKETTKLTALIYHQQIANSTELIGYPGKSHKLDALMELLTEGDLADENVIVYTRFRKMVDIIVRELEKKKVACTRITGAENEDQRTKNKKAFQSPKDKTRVIVINQAARQGVNLQSAKALIFYDTPWSAGDYLQILGRMIRIGSKHDAVTAYHLIVRGTIDDKVQQVLGKKMKLVERVLGKRLKGEDDEIEVAEGNEIGMLYDLLQQEAQKRRKR